MSTVMQRITPHDKERLQIRATKHGIDAVQEITLLLNLAEMLENRAEVIEVDPALRVYRSQFVRAPQQD